MTPALPIDVDAVRAAALEREPFPYLMVPGFVRSEAIADIEADFPAVEHPGSFPLPTLSYGPAFARFMDAIRGPEFTRAVADKFGIDLSRRPTMITVRGQSSARDGQIHTDSVTKLITVLIYMNGKWESPVGRLRLLRSKDNLNDVIAEVPPDEGTLLVFRNPAQCLARLRRLRRPAQGDPAQLGHQCPRRVVGTDAA